MGSINGGDMNSSRFSKILLCLSLVFFFLSNVELKNITYLSKKDLCPNLGDLQPRQIPDNSTYLDYFSADRKVRIQDSKGAIHKVSETTLRLARRIESTTEKDQFLKLYDRVCGGKPTFLNSMIASQKEKLNSIHNIQKTSRDRKRFERSLSKFHGSKTDLQKKVQHIKSKLEKEEPIRFQVMGKVLAEKGKDLILFGSSFPQKSSQLQIPGFVYNGIIILQNHKKTDIKSPDNYEVKHVQALDLEFVKRMSEKNILGENLPIYVFRHKKNTLQEQKIAKLQKELKENLDLLASIE
jgi:hypothetical protein